MEDARCADWKKFQRIDKAFRIGDLEELYAAVDDRDLIPNGYLHLAIGYVLVYAIYHSPLSFIRKLLEIGADPDVPVDDGFPPLIATLSTMRDVAGSTRRQDANEILELLLSYGADPNQRGINDYTPLHMAAALGDIATVHLLLNHGADPELRTRIDDYETPLEVARAAGQTAIASVIEHHLKTRQP